MRGRRREGAAERSGTKRAPAGRRRVSGEGGRGEATRRGDAPRMVRALRCSLRGLAAALRTEAAFRQEAALALVLVPVALWLPATPAETALLIASVLAVLVVELLNSAIETALDRHSREFHVLTARAKDLASAAVLLSLVLCASVWTLVLLAVHERGLLR